jgi:hypothetical protein
MEMNPLSLELSPPGSELDSMLMGVELESRQSRDIKTAKSAPKGWDAVKDILEGLIASLEGKEVIGEGVVAPFTRRITPDGGVIRLPIRGSIVRSESYKMILYLSYKLSYSLEVDDMEVNISEHKEASLFFRGMLDQLNDVKSLNWSTGSTFGAQGKASACLQIMKARYKIPSNMISQLPTGSSAAGKELFNLYLDMVSIDDKAQESNYRSLLRSIIGDYCKSLSDGRYPSIEGWKVPLSAATAGLNRTKETVQNNKKIRTVIKPQRPSERLEVLLGYEKVLINKTESCFSALHNLIEDNSNGVNPEELNSFRESYRTLLNECWQVVSQWSPTLTARRTFLLSFAHKKRNMTWNKSLMVNLIQSIEWSAEEQKSAYVLHYLPILDKYNEIRQEKILYTLSSPRRDFWKREFRVDGLSERDLQLDWYTQVGPGLTQPEDFLTPAIASSDIKSSKLLSTDKSAVKKR